MAALRIATKANQATSIPALLVATHVNQTDSNAPIDIKFEEVDSLKSGTETSVEFVVVKNAPWCGSQEVLNGLTAMYPVLFGKHETPVGYSILRLLIL